MANTIMCRSQITAAVAAAALALIVIFQLITTCGVPQVDFWHLRYDSGSRRIASHQKPLGSEGPDGGRKYMLGVGKADITGYGHILPMATSMNGAIYS